MWPYATRGSRFLGNVTELSASSLEHQDFSTNDVAIKLWLPQKLVAGIDVLCNQHNASRPDVLRWVFFEHVYGRVEFSHLQRRVAQRTPEPIPVVNFSLRQKTSEQPPRAINAEHLGKATEDLKLFLPVELKAELLELATRAQQRLSDYLRAVLARHLLGERMFRDWQDALASANTEARSYEAEAGGAQE